MKLTRLFGFCALVVYSAYLLFLEYTTSQETVDLYFTDIRGPVRFFAINTTLSTFFLWASALIHALNLSLSARFAAPARERAFWLSQVILFAYLGFDDRFSIHEWIGLNLGIDDVFVLITVAALELVVLVGLGRLGERPASVRRYLYAGGALFGVMTLIDGWGGHDARMRLSFEDLCKLWAVVMLFLFALAAYQDSLNRALSRREGLRESEV